MLNYHQVHFMHASAPRSGVDTSTTTTHSSVYSTLFSWVSHSCYDGAQHSQFGLGVGNKFSHSFLDFSISRQVAAGRDIAGYSSVHLHFKSFVPDFHGCINSALVAADSIDLFSE